MFSKTTGGRLQGPQKGHRFEERVQHSKQALAFSPQPVTVVGVCLFRTFGGSRVRVRDLGMSVVVVVVARVV